MLAEPRGASVPKSESQNHCLIQRLIMKTKIFPVRYQHREKDDDEDEEANFSLLPPLDEPIPVSLPLPPLYQT